MSDSNSSNINHVHIQQANKLTITNLESYPTNFILKFNLELDSLENGDLESEDFVVWQVDILGHSYAFLHGFPGDNPIGLLLTNDKSELLATCGEGGRNPINKSNKDVFVFLDWYDNITNNACNYNKIEFQASKLEFFE